METVTIFVTYQPAHSDITHSEDAKRLVRVGDKHAKKLQKEKRINMGIVKSKAKSFSLQNLATR